MNTTNRQSEIMDADMLFAEVKARLLPPSPVESVLVKLIEAFPRQIVFAIITPEHDVAVLSEVKGEYKSLGNSPWFALDLSPSPTAGWYLLEAALVRNTGNREACIEVFTQNNIHTIIPIPSILRGSIGEVFYLPTGVTRLNWKPTAAAGFFSQSPLLIHKISAVESYFRRAYRVVFDLWRFRNNSPESRAGLTWAGAVFNIKEAYMQSANLRSKRLMGIDYDTFVALNDTISASDFRAMRHQITDFLHRPIVSLIMPVRRAIPSLLDASIESVISQIYPDWELLLVADLSEGQAAIEILERLSAKDPRIQIVQPENGIATKTDISILLNAGLEASRGEFVARIDPHDIIPPHALYCVVAEHNKYPTADLIYSDDDDISEQNKRIGPRFKPDWNPDLLTSHHYLGNLIIYRSARLKELGGYRVNFEGAEDYELSLRYTKELQANGIRHIPRVLYHKRVESPRAYQAAQSAPGTLNNSRTNAHTQSMADSENGQDGLQVSNQAHEAGKRSLQSHFSGTDVVVEDGPGPQLYRVKYPLPAQPPLVSIIIPTRDGLEILKGCIESIRQKTDYKNWEMLVVDNQSTEAATLGYFAEIQKDQRIRVLRYEAPFNYSSINNFAVERANGEVLALLNNDVEVISHDWLTEMVSQAIRPGIGAVGAKLLYPNGTVQHAGVIIGLGGVAGHGHRYIEGDAHGYCHRAVLTQNLSAVTGACLVVKRTTYQEVGGLNEQDLAIAFNDVDFCLKLISAGYRNVITPYARLYHHESISRGHDDTPEKHALFMHEFDYMKNTWGNGLKLDPAYNPNLTFEFENFTLGSQSQSQILVW